MEWLIGWVIAFSAGSVFGMTMMAILSVSKSED